MSKKIITAILLLLISSVSKAATLDEAIRIFIPDASDTTAEVAPTQEMLSQARSAVKAALLIDPENEELQQIAKILETLEAGKILKERERSELTSRLSAFTTANSAVYSSAEKHGEINRAIQSSIAILPARIELLAYPTEVTSGGYSNLMWVSTQKECQISGIPVVSVGNMRIGPLDSDSKYTLSCRNERGDVSRKSVTIKVTEPPQTAAQQQTVSPPPQESLQEQPSKALQSPGGAAGQYPLGKLEIVSASASGYQRLSNGDAYDAAKAIDGDLGKNSRWSSKGISSNPRENEWIRLDLGQERRINSVRIAFYKYDQGRIYDYDIAISQDGKSWKRVVKNAKSTSSRWSQKSFPAEIGRYVKVTLNSASDNTRWANLYEIEILNLEQETEKRQERKKITLKWVANKERIYGYKVYFGTNREDVGKRRIRVLNSSSEGFDMASPSVTFDSKTDLEMAGGGEVCFGLRAFNGAGQSEMSEVVCGRI